MLAAGGGDGDSSDSSTDDAAQQREQAAAAGQSGGATRAHILRTRPRCSLLRRRGRPLSSLVSSISWLIRISWPGIVAWTGFMKGRHDSASLWAEATEGAPMGRVVLMRLWEALARLFSCGGYVEALGVCGCGEPVAACEPHVGLALGLDGASSLQSCVANWAGVAMRHCVSAAAGGGAEASGARWGERCGAPESRGELLDLVLVVLVFGRVESRGFVWLEDAVACGLLLRLERRVQQESARALWLCCRWVVGSRVGASVGGRMPAGRTGSGAGSDGVGETLTAPLAGTFSSSVSSPKRGASAAASLGERSELEELGGLCRALRRGMLVPRATTPPACRSRGDAALLLARSESAWLGERGGVARGAGLADLWRGWLPDGLGG